MTTTQAKKTPESKSLFQSYLFYGPSQQKVRQSVKDFAKSLRIHLDKVSPDIFIISPIKNSVTIDQVRNLKAHIFQKPVASKFKFILIESADKLTTEAQNALLKILEEPPSHTVIVLEAHDKSQLLPTILSRVIAKKIEPDREDTKIPSLLEEKNVLKLLEKIAQVNNPQEWLDDQITTLNTLLKRKIKGSSTKKEITIAKIISTIEKCRETKAMCQANVNPQFALANLVFSLKLND